MEGSEQPTAEDIQKAGAVSQAAAEAVAEAKNEDDARTAATAAVKRTAENVKLELSDEDCSRLVDMLIERMSALGAFDAPPAAQPSPEAAAAASDAEAAAATPEPAVPEKRTWAERFAGRA